MSEGAAEMTNEDKLRGFLKRATADLRLARRRIEEIETEKREPIAIVGMACRCPGEVSSPDELWELLAEGRDGVGGFPDDRGWDLDPGYSGEFNREGGFLRDVAHFDPAFFGISPREAPAIDPQQRLLMEVSWETLENAGIDPASLRGGQTGVFAGVMYQDYGLGRGSTASIVSGRIAYTLDLEGPTMTVDTACSSSLVSVHLAMQALRGGECSLALAGGVTVISTPSVFVWMGAQGGLAPDGRSKSFADAADGTGLSEGAGVLLLERLSDARKNGHPVLAVLRGSAINQDGASNGLSAPNGPSQERVIRQALANARLRPEDIDAVEAHGTGTTLGDPIEAGALLATYGRDRAQPLRLGSIKSNIGHTQAAAGVIGVIKMVMAMREGVLPKSLHLDAPSSKVDWGAGAIELLTEARAWQPNGRPRRAGVSSFGVSGTNAHVILEESLEADGEGEGDSDRDPALPGPIPLILSAKTGPALRDTAARLASHLEDNPDIRASEVAHSLAMTRSRFSHRAVAVGGSRDELLSALSTVADGRESPSVVTGFATADHRPVFLFSGQGAQHPRMALELYERAPGFARHILRCEEALEPHVDWSLSEVLADPDGGWMERVDVVQPALFAVMVSLARLWEECGVKPAAVVGHSQGEIAAAHIAGALTLDDAARVIALRSRAMTALVGKGGMLTVSLAVEELAPRLEEYGAEVSLAAINGPASLVVSGSPEALDRLHAECEGDGVWVQRIAVDYAAHSAQIEALRGDLIEAFSPITPQTGRIPFHSTVSGDAIDTAGLDAEYWYRNLRQTVRFEPVLRSMLEHGRRAFVEVGPHPVLAFGVQGTADEVLRGEDAAVLGTLRRDEGGPGRFVLSLAEAHAAGVRVDWKAFFGDLGSRRVPLPTYPFQRDRYWFDEGAAESSPTAMGLASAEHPLLAAAIESPQDGAVTMTGRISLQSHPWLADHIIGGVALFPGTGYLELCLHALRYTGAAQISEMTLQAPMIVPGDGALHLQVTIASPGRDGTREMAIHSRPEVRGSRAPAEKLEWVCNATGVLSDDPAPDPEPPSSWPPAEAQPLEHEEAYDLLVFFNGDYGPLFRTLSAAWRSGTTTFCETSLDESLRPSAPDFCVHPALIHGAFHSLMAGVDVGDLEGTVDSFLTFAWSGISLHSTGATELRSRVHVHPDAKVSIETFDQEGKPVVSIGSVTMRQISPERYAAARRRGDMLLGIDWKEVSLRKRPHATGLAVLGDLELPKAERFEDLAALREAVAQGAPAPQAVLCEAPIAQGADAGESARESATAALRLIQEWLSDDGLAEARLVLLTHGAVAVDEDESPDPAGAAVWGLARSAQMENPGRISLLDTDLSDPSRVVLGDAFANDAEPQLAVHRGVARVPRATRIPLTPDDQEQNFALDPDATVLITGGTGGLGALTARHLVEKHGARHLLLTSRSGGEAPGAAELSAELSGLGAEVRIAGCDVSDRDALKSLLDSLPQEHPLGSVFHLAGGLADGTIESLDAEAVAAVFGPKANAAWYLHELTAGQDLQAFVAYSSLAGTLGSPGQGNYAAANVFLDALMAKRTAEGLPSTSIAWGLWERDSAMTSDLSAEDQKRMDRTGVGALSDEQGMALFDAALASDRALAVAFRGNLTALRAIANAGFLPPLFRGLIQTGAPLRPVGPSLPDRLKGLPEDEWAKAAIEMVRAEVAIVLGYSSPEDIAPQTHFIDLGFDSLGAVELRNRLNLSTGLKLPATTVFDHPNVKELAEFLLAEVTGGGGGDGQEPEEAAPVTQQAPPGEVAG